MFKRTKGYLLLTMLVLTGLAGKLHSDTLSAKERRHLVVELKDSRAALLQAIEGLSSKQLNYRPGKKDASIKDCLLQLSETETHLWNTAQSAVSREDRPRSFSGFNDADLERVVPMQLPYLLHLQPTQRKKLATSEVLQILKDNRSEMLRFAKTTTESLRERTCDTQFGSFDVYQTILLAGYCTEYFTNEIEKIKAGKNFPK
jgi:hypothetical protein